MTVTLQRFDRDGCPSVPMIVIGELTTDCALSLDDAEAIAHLILEAVGKGRAGERATDGPERHAREIKSPGQGDDTRECELCGHPFALDSSPRFELCWLCAELDERETDR